MESVSPSGGTDFMYFLYLLSPFLYLFLFIFQKWIYIFILYHPQGWDKMYISLYYYSTNELAAVRH